MTSYSGVIAFASATTNFRRKKMDQTINLGIEVLNNFFFFGNINAFNVLIAVMARFMGNTEIKNTSRAESISHVLKAAGSTGDIGPDLDSLKPSEEQVKLVVTDGLGVMPAFGAEGLLTPEEIDAVSHFVANSAGK